jgi:hypothetical protein
MNFASFGNAGHFIEDFSLTVSNLIEIEKFHTLTFYQYEN